MASAAAALGQLRGTKDALEGQLTEERALLAEFQRRTRDMQQRCVGHAAEVSQRVTGDKRLRKVGTKGPSLGRNRRLDSESTPRPWLTRPVKLIFIACNGSPNRWQDAHRTKSVMRYDCRIEAARDQGPSQRSVLLQAVQGPGRGGREAAGVGEPGDPEIGRCEGSC